MDVLMIIVNRSKVRRKIKQYLKTVGMGQCIVMPSLGTSTVLEDYSGFHLGNDNSMDRMSTTAVEGETIFALNKEPDRTMEYLDTIAQMFGQDTKKRDSGIAFSIPVNEFFQKLG